MGKKVLAVKSGRAACSCAAAGGGIAAKNAKGAKSLTQRHKGTEKMKTSGNPWIGDVPEGWEVRRLRYLAEITTGNKDTQDAQPDGNYPFYVRSPVIERSNEYTFEGPGIMMAGDGAGAGRIFHYADGKYAVHQRVYRIYDFKDVTAYFLLYFLGAMFPLEMDKGSAQSTVPSVRLPMLRDLQVSLPPLPVQRAIAAYLDDKCGAIDEAIVEAKKGIEEYKAWKKSLIFEVVTGKRRVGAFNAKTQSRREAEKMKSSGIPWIGTIPEGWKVSRVKNECDCLDYLREPISAENRVNEKALYDYYGASGAIDKIDDFNVDDTVLLIGEDGANLRMRNLPLVYRASGKIWVNNHAHILKVKPSNDYGFMAYALEAGDYNDFVTGSAQPKLTQTDLMAMPVVLPSLPEQQDIADHLDEKCAAIDAMVAEKEALIADLEAYKKSLIYETVTGKREVA